MKQENIISCDDPRQAFINELRSMGFQPPNVLRIGFMERFPSPNDKRNGTAGWAVYYEIDQHGVDGQCIGVASFGSFNSFPEKENWSSKSINSMNDKERINYNAQIKQAQEQRELELKIIQKNASERALIQYNNATQATGQEPYLLSKNILPCDGVRVTYDKYSCGEIIIPIWNDTGLTSLQTIINEGEYIVNKKPIGNKKMMGGGKKQGCYFVIQGANDTVYIAEGYATGQTINNATGATVYIAFDSGNLYEVSSVVKTKYPTSKIIICGDDDKWKDNNAGRKKAIQASDALQIECVFPIFENEETKPTDFNDLHLLEGLDAVINQLIHKIEIYKPHAKIKGARVTNGSLSLDQLTNPTGILGDIVNYYNATDGNNQPLFAVQTALATCSVLLARNYETNFSNRTSLYFMNLGKSATGKERIKEVSEDILMACEKEHLLAGDGYTSGSGVISTLMDKPRHLTIMDEFSKYLKASKNKNGNGNLMDSLSTLMKSYTKLNGVIKPMQFSTLSATQEKKNQMNNMKVVNPAITISAIATPDDLFDTVDLASISDGFLNRFLICISDAERSIRKHKEKIEVPQNIIDWCNKISDRPTNIAESAVDKPNVVGLVFTDDAFDLQETFQQYGIDQANKLEKFGLSPMSGRLNEMAMRLSLIHALSRDPYSDVINSQDMEWGIEWVRYNYEVVIDKIKMSVSNSEHEGHKKEVLQAIRDIGSKGVTWSSMQKQSPFSKHKQKDLREILTALVDADLIFEDITQTGKQGRPSKLYKALA